MNTPQGVWNFAYTLHNPQTNTGRTSVTVTDPLLQKEKFEWEGHHGLTTDHRGGQKEVDEIILVDTSQKDAAMGKNLSETGILSETTPTGEKVAYQYGANDITATAAPSSKTNAPTSVTDARGQTTSFTYNNQGRVTGTTDPKGNVTQVGYSADGLDAVSVVNANGAQVMEASYNNKHQPLSVTTEDGTTSYSYTAWGAPQTVTDPLGTTTYLYNAERRLQSVTRDGVTLGSFTYDGLGRLKTQSDETGLTLSYAYDSLNRVTKVFYPDSTTEETDYACCGLPGVTKDRAGRRSYYDYDALKRLVRVQDANGDTLQMDYDPDGNMTRLLDARGHSTRWSYDASSRVTTKKYHDGKTETTSYDRGLVSGGTDARGRSVSYSYDANANLTKIDYANLTDVTLSYNALDDVTSVSDGVGTHGFSYSATGRLTALDGPFVGDGQSFVYDAAGRLQSQSVARGASGGSQSQSYTFDALERLQTLTSGGTQGAGTFTYNYVGNTEMLSRLDLPNGSKVQNQYDGLHRLTQVQNLGAGNANLASYAYGYDTRDVRTGVTSQMGSDPLKQIAYAYDAVDQLTGESASGGLAGTAYSNAFQYDSMGNRTRAENVADGNTHVTSSTANTLNQLTALSHRINGGAAQNSGLSYDASGNLTQALGSEGNKSLYTYDDNDRLIRIENRNAAGARVSKSEFTYDFASRKAISREFSYTNGAWVKTGETRRVFDGLDVVQERNAANEVTAQYTRDGNIGGILARTSQSGKSYFHYDGGGNVTALSDENGALVARYAYDAFGNTLEASGPRAQENPYRFSTKEWHAASGMYDYGYRFYSPGMGRWLNRDPIRENGGVNLYGFVTNNPVNYSDPSGLYWETVLDAGGAAYDINEFRKRPSVVGGISAVASVGAIFVPIPGPGTVKMGINAARAAKAAAKAAKVQESLTRRANLLAKYAKSCDKEHLDAVRRELWGEIVKQKRMGPKSGDPFNHIMEVRETMNGLRSVIKNSKNALKDPSHSSAVRATINSQLITARRLLRDAENAFKSGP